MAKRKPAPRYARGLYTKIAAFTGGRLEQVRVVDIRKSNYDTWLYTLETEGSGAFGGGRKLVYEHELRILQLTPVAFGKAA